MKRVMLFAAALVIGASLCAAYSQSAQQVFEGLLIFVNDTTCEVKWGSAEHSFTFGENVTVTRGDTQLAAADLQVCQMVRVTYTPGQPNVITGIVILRDSYCMQQ